jgi:hypothetical protein
MCVIIRYCAQHEIGMLKCYITCCSDFFYLIYHKTIKSLFPIKIFFKFIQFSQTSERTVLLPKLPISIITFFPNKNCLRTVRLNYSKKLSQGCFMEYNNAYLYEYMKLTEKVQRLVIKMLCQVNHCFIIINA